MKKMFKTRTENGICMHDTVNKALKYLTRTNEGYGEIFLQGVWVFVDPDSTSDSLMESVDMINEEKHERNPHLLGDTVGWNPGTGH